MAKRTKPTKEEVQEAAEILKTIRVLLETVPMAVLEGAAKDASSLRTRYMTLGPMLDPTDYQRNGADKERDLETQVEAALALLKLKKIWRQDVPLDERIQDELDRGALKE